LRREEKRVGRFILPIIIVVIFVGSMFGVMIGGMDSEEDIIKENGLIFREISDGLYSFKIDGVEYKVGSLPSDVSEKLEEVPANLVSDINGASKIYVASEGVDNAFYDFYFNFKKFKNLVISCLPEDADEEGCKDLPLKSCEDASGGVMVFVLKTGDNNLVYDGSCFVLESDAVYAREVIDAILFKYLGVFDGE